MPDKSLTEAEWKAVVKGKEVKDDELLKALGQWARAEKLKSGPAALAAQREALGAIEKAAAAFGRLNAKVFKADKALIAAVAQIERAVARTYKELEVQAREAERGAAAGDSGDDESDDTPDVLTNKMAPILRQVRQGLVAFTKIATTGKATVVLLSRKSISPARRKLLTDHLGQTGGVKFIDGQCLLEEEVITFVVASQAAGLAKKIKQALFDQTGLRLKLRVRGETDGDVDDAVDDEGEIPPAPPRPDAPPAPPSPAPSSPELLAFNQQLKTLLPEVQAAVAAGHPQAGEFKRLASEAGALARQGQWAAAQAQLAALKALLDDPPSEVASAEAAAPPPGVASAPAAGRFVHHARSRLAWQQTRKKIQADLAALENAILAHYAGAPDLPALATSVRKLDGILLALDDSLADVLDQALNAPTLERRAVLHEQARGILARYRQFVEADPLLKALDGNPFVPLKTHALLSQSLQVLDKSLA